jgi:hypothetical protein
MLRITERSINNTGKLIFCHGGPITPQGGNASLTSLKAESRGYAAGLCLGVFFSQSSAKFLQNFGHIFSSLIFPLYLLASVRGSTGIEVQKAVPSGEDF